MKKKALTLTLALTTLALIGWFGSQALATAPSEVPAPVEEAETPAPAEEAAAPTPAPAELPEAIEAGFCGEADCWDDSDCEALCPSASSVVCDSNNYCHYFFGSGGSSGGGSCPESDCFDDSDCQSECPSASVAICTSQGSCFYG